MDSYNNKTLTLLFGLYLLAHIVMTSIQIYQASKPVEASHQCNCQK